MAYSGAVHAYGWLKPTLTVELVEGGTLLPNTKYYVMGFMGYTAATYHINGGPLSDVHEITTTTTALSIRVTHKTYRNITAFADNGDSRTLVTSARHCVSDGVMSNAQDSIKIDTGSYAGTHAVDEWVDYNQFIIDTPYVDNVPVQCYTDSQYYNRPFGGGGVSGMAIYIHTESPYDTDGLILLTGRDKWDRRPWTTPDGGFANPKTYTLSASFYMARYSGHPELNRYGVGVFQVLNDYGSINIDTNGSVTLEDIYDEVQASGFIYNCSWAECGYARKNKFSLFGSLRAASGTSLVASGCEITTVSDFFATDYNFDSIVFTDCLITSQGQFSVYKCFTANNSVYWDTATTNNYSQWVRGTNLIIYGAPRASYTRSDDYGTYWDEFQEATKNIGIIQNKIFRANGGAMYQQNSYNSVKYENCDTVPIYWILTLDNKPDIYMAENCIMRYAYTYDFCIRFYHYQQYTDNELKFLNIDCPDDVDNHKKVVRNRDYFNLITRFYRKAEIYVQDAAGVDILGATIEIVDDALNEYSTTSDVNGYGYLDVLEQMGVVDDTMTFQDPETTTYYTDFVITISKAGYATQTLHLDDLYTNEKQTVTLLASTAETVLIGSTIYGSTIQ